MNIKETVLQVIAAALAVIGFYGVLHGLFEALLAPRELAVAVILTELLPPEELDILLCEARRAPARRGKRVVLVLAASFRETGNQDEELWGAYTELAEKYGASLCFCEDCGQGEP